ncbi:MAG: branched-chain amino acid ABC transporter permease [Firmicutes bacterium]|nr:branched-chain amino acid ABC transporter permease [Bacillota bacterium]
MAGIDAILVPLLSGLSEGVVLFLVASGLTLVLGVMRIANFAHGGYFMLGAYFAYTLLRGQLVGVLPFVAAVLGAAALTGAAGYLSELLLFERFYRMPRMQMLLGTYALLLILEGIAQQAWGLFPITQPEPMGFIAGLTVGGTQVPYYEFFLILVGLVAVVGLEYLLRRTAFGRQVRAVAEDRLMGSLLGIDVGRVYALMLALGVALAGLGGALTAPTVGLIPDIAVQFVIQAFAVVIIGGFGSVTGSLVAALLVGVMTSFLVSFAPSVASFSLYLLMALVLLLRPQGIMGRPWEEEER